MRSLIDDLLQFSRTNKSEKVFENTNFNVLLENSKQDLAQVIEAKKAKITNEKLPETDAIPFQIQQLFTNLINNSLKYSKEKIKPEINIFSTIVDAINEPQLPKIDKTKYYKITFKDNGIGFDNEYAEKIFSADDKLLFQNLIEIENGVRLYYDFEYFWDDEKNDLVCKQEPTDYFIEIFNNTKSYSALYTSRFR